MKKYIFGLVTFVFLFLSISVFAQSKNWADYGISEQDAKYLTESEKKEILGSLTPQQTLQKREEDIKKYGTSSIDNLFVSPRSPSLGIDSSKQDTSHITSCFDLYSFGSIQADMTSETSDVVAGTKMSFSGDIKNNNDYPVVQGTLYVKIFKTAGAEKNSNGPDVVDQFVVAENISLPAHASVPASFVWNVPANAQTGEYQLVTYFTSDKKFNLLGLSFTDDVVGNSFDFSIDGEKTGVTFDKSSVTINNDSYHFAAYPMHIPKDEPAKISLSVKNTTNEIQDAQIVWQLYKWDGINPSNLIRTFTDDVQVQKGTQTVTVAIPENTDPVYYLVGQLVYEHTKSIVNIRYVKEGVDKVRLNFPAVTSYPLEAGKQATIFTCLHNSGTSSQVPNNKVVLEVLDENGRSVDSYTYDGIVTGDMMAIKNDFIPKNTMDVFSVHASIYTNGVLVDESTMQYDCKLLDPANCTSNSYKNLISIATSLIILLGIILYSKKRHVIKKFITPLAVLFVVSSILIPHVSEAKSQSWNTVVNKNFAYLADRFEYSVWAPALSNPNMTIKYNVQIKNKDTDAIVGDNSKVLVGTNLIFKFLPQKSTDVYWFGTGFSGDSPYGEWRKDAAPPPFSCNEKDFLENFARTSPINNHTQDYNQDVYIPLVVNFPKKTLTGTNNLTCGALEGDETKGYSMECKVINPGTITPQFHFATTQGKFYYRYKENGCYGNNIPLSITDDIRDWKTLDFQVAYNDIYSHATKISDFSLNVPQQTIIYNLNAVAPPLANTAPTPPTITGPQNGYSKIEYTFNFKATDPDKDKIRYAIDWNNDGKIDQWLPSAGTVNSGTSQSASKIWWQIGTKKFRAKTFDEQGNASAWTTHTIILTDPPIDGACGTAHTKTYPSPRTTYTPDTQCARGTPSITTFPSIGGSLSWTCSGQNGGTISGTCTASRAGTISVTLTATPPGPLNTPGSINLSWTTTGNPTSCDASNFWSGTNITNGSPVTYRRNMTPGTYVFDITCHKANTADATSRITVFVNPTPPVVTLKANPISGASPLTSTLTWTVSGGAKFCTAGNGWTGTKNVAGSNQTITGIISKRTYTLYCTNAAGTSNTAIVTVTPTSICTGIKPSNATLCTGDDTGLISNVPRSLVTTCSQKKCEYSCVSGYYKDGTQCLPYTCKGPIPSHASLCTADDIGLTSHIMRSLVTSCSSTKCEYTCQVGYILIGGVCRATAFPTIDTPTAKKITSTSATLGARVTSVGVPSPLTRRGICWSTHLNPTVKTDGTAGEGGTTCQAEGGVTSGIFTIQDMTGFSLNTQYHYRGYAINPIGTAYTTDTLFTTTPGPSGTLTATHCTIPAGASSCTTFLNWTTQNLITGKATAVTTPGRSDISAATSGTNVPAVVNYGSRNFFLYHDAAPLDQATATASCAAESNWNGSECKFAITKPPIVTLLANPISGASPLTSTLVWTVSGEATFCTAGNGWNGQKNVIGGSQIMKNITSITTYTLYCGNANGISNTASVTLTPTIVNTKIDGVCGAAHNAEFPTMPVASLCLQGSATIVSGDGPWTWSCEGMFGGTSEICIAKKSGPPVTPTYSGCFADGASIFTLPTIKTYEGFLTDRIRDGKFGYLLSDSDRTLQNQTFLTRLNQNTNTYIINQYESNSLFFPAMLDLYQDYGASIIGTSTPNPSGYYFYTSLADTRIHISSSSEISTPKVVYTEGIDIQIDDNIVTSGAGSVVIIARKGIGGGGNVYIDPSVGKIDATIIADGALINGVDGASKNWIDNSSELTLPLIINGRLLTHNTRGGSLQVTADSLVQRKTDLKCGGYSKTPDCSDISIAASQDLERFRLTTGTTGQCTLYVTGIHTNTIPILSGILY